MIGLAQSEKQGNNAAFYQALANPVANPLLVWYLEPNGENYAMRNLKVDYLQFQTEWSGSNNDLRWRNNDQKTAISWTGLGLAYADDAWTLTSTQYSRPLGIYDNGTGDPVEGNEIGANDAANGQKFQIYAISRTEFAALMGEGATKESPKDLSPLIFNSDFENSSHAKDFGWTVSSKSGGNYNFNGAVEAWHYGNFDIHQTLTVPNGSYTVTVQIMRSASAYLYAGTTDNKAFNPEPGSGGNFAGVKDEIKNDPTLGRVSVDVLVTNGKLTFGIADPDNATAWLVFDNFQLFYNGVISLDEYKTLFDDAIATAKTTAAKTDKVSATVKGKLNAAITKYEGKTYDTADAYTAAIEELNAAIAAVNTSINSYKVIEAGVVPDNSLDGWVCENTNTFHINTWSGEGNEDGSNMKTPFIENWVAKGSFLGAGKVYYQLTGLEPGEIYYAQALVRSYNEASADAPNGPNFFINDTKVDMATEGITFTYKNMSGIYATLGGAAVVGEDGTLTLGVEIAADRNYNWVAFKSVSIMPMEKAFEKALAAAKSYQNVDMSIVVKNKLNTTIQTYEGATINTVEGYEKAIAALNDATEEAAQSAEYDKAILAMNDLMESTNVYTAEAYSTYKAIFDQAVEKHNAGTLTGVVYNPYAKNTKGNKAIDYDDLLLSAWAIGGEQCKDYDKALYINTWSSEGDNDGTNFKVPFFEYWVSDANSLGENALTATLTEIPEGKYEVTAWVRVRTKNNTAVTDATGITLQVNDGDAVDVTKGDQIGTSQFNIGKFNASGEVLDGTLKIQFAVAADNNISWLSFQEVKYTRTGDATAISEVAKKAAAKTIFNVAGQQIESLQKGINIVDGKKVYVK